MKLNNIKWVFFDMGSTLIDETLAMEHRIREIIAGTEITFEHNDYAGGYMDWCNLRTLHVGKGKIDFNRFFDFVKI